jgi:hypothetical protein
VTGRSSILKEVIGMMRLAILSFGVALSLAPSGAAPVPKDHKSPFFPTKIGTQWVYKSDRSDGWRECESEIRGAIEKDGSTTLTIVDKPEEGETQPWKVTVSEKGISLVSQSSFRYEPPIEWLRLPAKVGNRWKVDTWSVAGLSNVPKWGQMRVGAIETVKTPAGEFEAARVEGAGGGFGAWEEKYWFARGVGLVKWVSNARDEYVLKSFKLVK